MLPQDYEGTPSVWTFVAKCPNTERENVYCLLPELFALVPSLLDSTLVAHNHGMNDLSENSAFPKMSMPYHHTSQPHV
jgi:hypothetical protein